MKSKIKLSLVIPAYRERGMIGPTLKETASFLEQHKLLDRTEVIVVAADGGDGTADISRSNARLFKHFVLVEPGEKVGKGRDVREGMKVAKGDYCIFTDADLATPLHHIPAMLEKLEAGSDVVIGVRNLEAKHSDLMRRWSSKLSNILINLLAVPGIRDTQCGFKGFTRDSGSFLFEKQTIMGWGFDIELLAIAQMTHCKIVTMDIDDWTDPKGESGLVGESQFGAMMRTLGELVRVRINIWKGVYDDA